jgi:hypothetical protein
MHSYPPRMSTDRPNLFFRFEHPVQITAPILFRCGRQALRGDATLSEQHPVVDLLTRFTRLAGAGPRCRPDRVDYFLSSIFTPSTPRSKFNPRVIAMRFMTTLFWLRMVAPPAPPARVTPALKLV